MLLRTGSVGGGGCQQGCRAVWQGRVKSIRTEEFQLHQPRLVAIKHPGQQEHRSLMMYLIGCCTMRFEGTAKVLAECKLKYYRISECAGELPAAWQGGGGVVEGGVGAGGDRTLSMASMGTCWMATKPQALRGHSGPMTRGDDQRESTDREQR